MNAATTVARTHTSNDENKELVRRYYEEVVSTGAVDEVSRFVSSGCIIVIINWFLWKPYLPAAYVEAIVRLNDLLPLPTRLLYGGFTEELLLRWGLMSLLVWAGWRLFQKGHGKPQSLYFIIAIVVSAILFGLGHLPFMFALVPDVSAALIVYVIVGNFVFGAIAGYLYWKRGLESAILAHMIVHVL